MRIGPRLPMTVGPIVMGVATLLLMRIDADGGYWLDILPGVTPVWSRPVPCWSRR